MTNIILSGCNGKMGQVIARLLSQDDEAKVIFGYDINTEMKLAAAYAIASLISDEELKEDYIIVPAFDERVGDAVSKAVYKAAVDSGVSRI